MPIEKCVGAHPSLLHPGHIIHQPLPPTPLQLQQQQHAPPPPPPPPTASPQQAAPPVQLPPTPPHTPKAPKAPKHLIAKQQVSGAVPPVHPRTHAPHALTPSVSALQDVVGSQSSLASRPPSQGQCGQGGQGLAHSAAPSPGAQAGGATCGASQYAELHDLIHLPGPLTEDAVLKCLHGRFAANQLHTNVGPILLSVNAYHDVGNPLTLSSTRGLPLAPQLLRVVRDAVRQQAETGYPQAMILSGCSGSGKTHAAMLLLRQLFDVAGGGPETDAFKHLAAAFTVLRALGSAKTASNSESSRIVSVALDPQTRNERALVADADCSCCRATSSRCR